MLGVVKRLEVHTNINDLQTVRLRVPGNAGFRWKGVSHYDLMQFMMEHLAARELEPMGLRFYLRRDSKDITMSCCVPLPDQPNHQASLERGGVWLFPAFGMMNSNARRFRTTFFAGVADLNGRCAIVAKKWLASKRHTTRWDPKDDVKEALLYWEQSYPQVVEMIERLRNRRLNTQQSDHILAEALDQKMLTSGRIRKVAKVLGVSNYQGKTTRAFELAIAFSIVNSQSVPTVQLNNLYNFGQLLLKEYDLVNPEVNTRRVTKKRQIKQLGNEW